MSGEKMKIAEPSVHPTSQWHRTTTKAIQQYWSNDFKQQGCIMTTYHKIIFAW